MDTSGNGISEGEARAPVLGLDARNRAEVSQLKSKGDFEFSTGNHLKAAAIYTRALAIDCANSTIRSNRVLALIRIGLVSKALQDTTYLLNQDPNHLKSIYRKALVLSQVADANPRDGEALQSRQEAYELLKKAYKMNPSSVDVIRLQRKLESELGLRLTGFLSSLPNVTSTNDPYETRAAQSSKNTSGEAFEEVPGATRGVPVVGDDFQMPQLSENQKVELLLECLRTIIATVADLMKVNGTDIMPQYYLFHPFSSQESNYTQVRLHGVFSSPTYLLECSRYLAELVRKTRAIAGCTIAPRGKIKHPVIWSNAVTEIDGVVVQIESAEGSRVLYIPHKAPAYANSSDPQMLGISEQAEDAVDAWEMDSEYLLHSVWDFLR
eukprot:CAMPEP_0184489964 /NCGR_PEP_ID=MMETSP0113_2-20130426/16782_1 /TAXON_ID=91329 /ORGANISM="Norrisiella sphaerica, Strain BC52" /LENGTH=380 /DNA_ID=CAMNT_0026873651 /DNA_START=107 /DNA_END=1249 /DNA_ORIENTATION=-